jgi:hypothetical protein
MKMLPENLTAHNPEKDPEAAIASTVCAVLAMGMQRATKGEGRGLLSTL